MSATLNDSDKPYAEEGYKLMGAVFEVHKARMETLRVVRICVAALDC